MEFDNLPIVPPTVAPNSEASLSFASGTTRRVRAYKGAGAAKPLARLRNAAAGSTDATPERVAIPLAAASGHGVRRSGLLYLLHDSTDARLVTLVAGPGFGKTVCMRQYCDLLQSEGVQTAWVTLSSCDDHFERFIGVLSTALLEVLGDAGAAELRSMAHVPHAPESEIAGRLRDVLEAANQPFALFIDGFETIQSPEVSLFVRLFVGLVPAGSKVVLAARRNPCLLLGNFRARGQLLEIEQSLLCLARPEAEQLVAAAGLQLAEDEFEKLYRVTDGWPAVLRLAIGALRTADDRPAFIASFSAATPAVAELLNEELLARETPELQAFLLRASILGELNAPLCNAVCRTDASDDLLQTLDGAKAYVAALNSERSLYRFQPLVRAHLRRELARRMPGELAELHLAAARWFHAQGRIAPAMDHAIESGDTEYALALLNSCAESLLCQGRSRIMVSWFDRLPAAALQPHYRLRIVRMWSLATIRRSDVALRLLEEMQAEPGHGALSDAARLEIAALKSCILAVMDRAPEAAWLVRAELAKLPAEDSVVRRILVTTLALWKVATNEFSDAISFGQMYQYRDEQDRMSSGYYATFVEGLIALAQCRVRQSIAHFRVALGTSTRAFRSVISLHLAEALYEIGEVDEARQLLEQNAAAIRDFGHSDHLIISHVLRARIAHAAGSLDLAFLQLSELEHLARHADLPRALASAQLERARMAMLDGDADAARAHYQRARQGNAWAGLRGMILPANDVETLEMCAYRQHVHGITHEDVISALTADYRSAHAVGRHRRALRLSLMLAKAQHLSGQTRQAMRTVEAVLRAAMQDGLTRVFLDEGAPVVELIRVFRIARRDAAEVTGDARLVAFIDEILAAAGIDLDVKGGGPESVPEAPVMTARERQILHALASGLSNIKIAERLFVSETTVRSHLRKISVKLGTSSRTQSVCVARSYGLV